MKILIAIFATASFLLIPALTIHLCKKYKFLGQIGEILLLYIIGLILGNFVIFPFENISSTLAPIQDLITSISVPLAMPLILFSCNIKTLPVKSVFKSLLFGIIAISATIVSGYYIISHFTNIPQLDKISGMLVGVYTGGTPNLASLKMMLDVDNQTYLMINTFDMAISFLYLIVLMSFGIKLSRKFINGKKKEPEHRETSEHTREITSAKSYSEIFSRTNRKYTIGAILLAIAIAAISIGISFLITGKIDMLTLILSLTTLSIACSFIPTIGKAAKSYDAGMYLVLIFSITVASMVDISKIDFTEGLWLAGYIAYSIFVSLIIQLLFSKIFKIDPDTTIISSVALINSPLFVPMIAKSMNNKNVIISGITIGIIGYAVGNYLGVIMASILQ